VSPDGNWLAVDVDDGNEASIYMYRLAGGSQIHRLTLSGHNRFPIWSADSRSVTFQSDASGDASLFSQRADESEPPQRLTTAVSGETHVPEAWSPDGKTLLFSVVRDGVYELHTYSVEGKHIEPFADVKSMYPPGSAFSSDGRLVAYYQRNPGSNAGSLFVRQFPSGPRHEVEKGGGLHPIFLSGPEPFRLIYTLPNLRRQVDITLHPDFALSEPVEVPLGPVADVPSAPRTMDTVGNRDQFVMVSRDQPQNDDTATDEPAIEVVLNWLEDVKIRGQERK
jgi:hypothetical protein